MSKPITLTARVPSLAVAVVAAVVVMGCNDESLQVSQNQQALTSCVTIRRGAGVVADATIASSAKRQNFGGQSSLKVDKKNEVLLRFELGAIPSSAVVNSALLKLYVPGESGCDHDDDDDDENDHGGHGGHERRGARWHHDNGHHQSATIKIHRAAQAWVESSVTYTSFNQRFDPAVAGLLRTSDPRSQKSADVKALVAAWVSGAKANQGFLLETSANRRTVLVSSENPDPALRPVLEVCYTTPDDHCSPNPCQNGAACVNGQSGYTCTCAAGYTGVNCEVNINECAPQNPCQNGGTCADGVGGYTCTCAAGYAGASCQINIDDCSPNPCQNSGICTDGVNSHSCACDPGYGGADCEINIDECAGSPCQNGGVCTDGVSSYTCACAAGFVGANCEVNIDECAPNPCQNGGTCIDGVASRTCACAPGYTGLNCEVNIDECAPQNPCQNGGVCVDGVFAYSCQCAPGYGGANCQLDINDCSPNPCQNGGTCTDGVNSYTCACAPGYGGVNCGACAAGYAGAGCHDVDECAPVPAPTVPTCAWNVAAQASINELAGVVQNPFGAWTYFYGSGEGAPAGSVADYLTRPIVLYNTTPVESGGDHTNDWYSQSTGTLRGFVHNVGDNVPMVVTNTSPNPAGQNTVYGAHINFAELLYHPGSVGSSARYNTIRWTAPAAGTYHVEASWRVAHAAAVDFAILKNHAAPELATGTSSAAGTTRTLTIALLQGETLDFAIGFGTSYGGATTGIAVKVRRTDGGCPVTCVDANNNGVCDEFDIARPSVCQVGTCVNLPGSYLCDVDACAPNPCQNGGACADGVGSYTCTCAPGYSGTRCETAVFSACSPNPTRATAGACGRSSARCWFQTSCAYTGAQIGGLSGADAKCQAHADAAGLGGTYKAWLSSGAVSAASRLSQAAVPYVNVNGHVIVANWTELTNDGFLNAPGSGGEPNRLENGTISGGNVWTNTAANGSLSSAANHCDGFTSNAGVAGFGHSDYVDGARYTTFGVQSCAVSSRLYCFEQ